MSPAEESDLGTVRIVTWNIHGGVGTDRRCDLDRTLKALLDMRPDVAALQEVDGRIWLGRQPRAFERIGQALGGHVVEARLTGRGERAYGHLLWSRWPLDAAAVRSLPGGRIEPRAVIDATVRTPRGPLRVLAAHFGLVPADRRRQSACVAALCEAAGGPVLTLGDFNDWRLAGGAVHRLIGGTLPRALTAGTWPSRRPFVAMDRIYASADLSLVRLRTGTEAAAASDHLALIADLRF